MVLLNGLGRGIEQKADRSIFTSIIEFECNPTYVLTSSFQATAGIIVIIIMVIVIVIGSQQKL